MTSSDLTAFQAVLSRLAWVFRVRTDTAEFAGLSSSYFRALQRFDIGELERGADLWTQAETRFPKPAEWADRAAHSRRPVVVLRVLTEREARDWRRADGLSYEDAACGCPSCVEAGMAEKPLRFVPDVDDDGRPVQVREGSRVVTAGHWAHGWELARWYEARANFYNRVLELGLRPSGVLDAETGSPLKRRQKRSQFVHVTEAPKRPMPAGVVREHAITIAREVLRDYPSAVGEERIDALQAIARHRDVIIDRQTALAALAFVTPVAPEQATEVSQ